MKTKFGLIIVIMAFNLACSQQQGVLIGNTLQQGLPSEAVIANPTPIEPVPEIFPETTNGSVIDVNQVMGDGGFGYVIFLSGMNAQYAYDCSENNSGSSLVVFENGQPLAAAHSLHAEIRNLGMGRFSHWGILPNASASIRFSASDNTDPRTNGRTYTFINIPN